ncbi:MAG: hypothetical protein HZA47_11050 [Planctomycetes bacterium]|nr:hypothetical protein [Planctomycetota bacterium]
MSFIVIKPVKKFFPEITTYISTLEKENCNANNDKKGSMREDSKKDR